MTGINFLKTKFDINDVWIFKHHYNSEEKS